MSEFIFEDRAAWVTDINGNSSKINRRGEVVLPFAVLAVYDSHNILVGNEIKTLESFEDGELKQLFLIWILRIHRGYIVFLFGIVCKQCVRFLFL